MIQSVSSRTKWRVIMPEPAGVYQVRLKPYMDKGKDDRIGNLQWYTIHSEFLNRFKDLCTLGDSQVKDLMITGGKKQAASRQQKYN